MPYESFKRSHHLSIRGLVQDQQTGGWRYVLQVTTIMRDRSASAGALASTAKATAVSGPGESSDPARLGRASSVGTACTSHAYIIRRSWTEFKQLHQAVRGLMSARSLPPLPTDSLFAFFMGETQASLHKKRVALEAVLHAIEAHSLASDASAYLEFLANTDTYQGTADAPPSPIASYPGSGRGYRVRSTDASDASIDYERAVEFQRYSLH
ncbi:TPA: hypothetical protein N0F65_010439 [Lagenidium giganteum]|uniref:PX domain-containing protein n=1 Tax=Lagenidium giganteum TaxID=4803 RepID=A0AAV2YUS9_9STRA|nr:TPA: hypothetical protein N0F65_010439 [Lagenidium giganteum]